MEGKVRKMFPGGNTSKGFKSFFDYVIPKDVNIIFCMKGGPGVGKSSLMKKVAKDMIDKGYDLDFSVKEATNFIYKAINYTSEFVTDRNDGVMFEMFLNDLTCL